MYMYHLNKHIQQRQSKLSRHQSSADRQSREPA